MANYEMENKAEILLVRPNHSFLKKELSLEAPLGLAYLASYLRQKNIHSNILDALAMRLSAAETLRMIIDSKSKYIGFSSLLIFLPIVYALSRKIKKSCDKKIIIGGPFSTFMPERWLKECREIDILVRGEGEETLSEILSGRDIAAIKGITYRLDDKIHTNSDREFIKNIDNIPFPARDKLPGRLYRPRFAFSGGVRGLECASMITARGCVNKCYYCSASHFWNRFRARSPENILSEIESLLEAGAKHIDFLDDTFTVPERLKKICTLINERKLRFSWGCFGIISQTSCEMLNLMRQAGCRAISFAPESGNQAILDKIEKRITLDKTTEVVSIAKKLGIKVTCQFMVGIPGDTRQTILETGEFSRKLNPDFATFTPTTPFPGTRLYNDYVNSGILKNEDTIEDLLKSLLFIGTEKISARDIKDLRVKLVKRFYFRPAFFINVLKRIIRYPGEVREYLRAIYLFLFERTDLNCILKLNSLKKIQ